jgi:hypothetical protein
MNSNDEDYVFDNFIKLLPSVFNSDISKLNIDTVKKVFEIKLKLLSFVKKDGKWIEDIPPEEIEKLDQLYNSTKYIIDNVSNNVLKSSVEENILIIKKYWDDKLTEQKKLNESFSKSNDKFQIDNIKNSCDILKISNFIRVNIYNTNLNIIPEIEKHFQTLEKMLNSFDENKLQLVKENIKKNEKFYKDKVDDKNYIYEIQIYNILSNQKILLIMIQNINKNTILSNKNKSNEPS